MWCETLGPGVSSKDAQDWDYFRKFQRQQLDEMLDNALNHASVQSGGGGAGAARHPDAGAARL